ncbi:hypothetical protein GX888_01205 [Candidatus Dojkabacteria bacterium]|uniref:Rubredoxin-like domain-containing protein n=1 Tax=Candidatus Dojkabacteria bacterium TaxID=2099670 RepID=A0A847VD75_9BACT|nr:hypothetical protein [Candidatus Dojkabacteria bacterium]
MENTSKINSNQSNVPDPINHVNPEPVKSYIEDPHNPEDLDIKWLRWKCLKCGYLYEGVKELKKCPNCGNDDVDYFGDTD